MFRSALCVLLLCSVSAFAQSPPTPVGWKHSTASLTIKNETGVSIDASGGNRTVTLPSAFTAGRHIIVRKYDSSANTVTIQPAAGDTINLTASLVLTTQGQTASLYATGIKDWTDAANTFGLVTTSGAVAPASAVVGGGYGATGTTISTTGNISANGNLIIDGTSTLTGACQVGGGYGSTGVTLSGAGVIQANGAITTDGTLTALQANVGTASSNVKTYSVGAGEVDVEAVGTEPVINFWLKTKGAGFFGFGNSLGTGDAIVFYPEDAAQSAISTVGTQGLKVSNGTATGPINIGGSGSGADINRWGVNFLPAVANGPVVHPIGGPAPSTDGNLNLSALGTGLVRTTATNGTTLAPVVSSMVHVGGITDSFPKWVNSGAAFEAKTGADAGYATVYGLAFRATSFAEAPYVSLTAGGYLQAVKTTATTPAPTDYGAGSFWIHKDSVTGNVYLAYNDGGVIKSVQLP